MNGVACANQCTAKQNVYGCVAENFKNAYVLIAWEFLVIQREHFSVSYATIDNKILAGSCNNYFLLNSMTMYM